MLNKEKLLKRTSDLKQWLTDIRRDFHRYPELGMEEYRTRGQIIHYLTEMGIPYEKNIANTAVVGLIEGNKSGKTVALRADMDALPITEQNEVEYKSLHTGKMHACGHDAHTTILLGAARILNENKHHFDGNVKLFFQPAEETVGGAKPMIAADVMESPTVDAVFGLHVAPEIPTGEIAVKYDQMNASSDTILITIKGENGHGAYPHRGIDAIVIAAYVTVALQTIVSRNVDPRQAAVISIGKIEGGTGQNIIAEKVSMVGTVRTLDPHVRKLVLQRIELVLAQTTAAFGGDYEFTIGTDGYEALVNTNLMVDIVMESAKYLFGVEKIQHISMPSMGVEDFSYFAAAAPAAFYRIGCRNDAKGIVHDAHTGRFDIDEDCLAVGVALQVMNVVRFLKT